MPEVFGTDYIEAARDHLVTHITALKTTMDGAGDYDPDIDYIYPRHNEVMLLDAVSIDLDVGDSAPESTGTVMGVTYRMAFTIRVHTAYIGGKTDSVKIARLINSIINKLHKNVKLATSYYIDVTGDFTGAREFDESYTIGGEITVVVQTTISQTRET